MSGTMIPAPGGQGRVALSVRELTKRYPGGGFSFFRRSASSSVEALRGISFDLAEGQTLGLLGPNGAGKTTLLRILSTLLYPSSGRVTLYGEDVFQNPDRIRGMIGLVTCDERSFYWRLTGRHNLSFFAALYGLSKREASTRIDELLSTLGLTEAADRPYSGYSSGMKQKLAIARGLLRRPRLVFYDEPLRSLDPVSTRNIRQWILENRTASPDRTDLIATNQLHEAEQLCDRVLILNKGSVIAYGTIAEIRRRWHADDFEVHRVVYHGEAPLLPPSPEVGLLGVEEQSGPQGESTLLVRTLKDSEGLTLVLEAILKAGCKVVRCSAEEVPFDETFFSLVVAENRREERDARKEGLPR